jgi:hypothetical protein
MVGTRDVNEVKMEGEDGDYPPVDTRAGRDVRIRQHPFDIPGVDFYYKISDSNEIEAQGMKHTIETIDFYSWEYFDSLSLSIME